MLDLVSQSSSFDGNGLEFLHEIVSATLISSLLEAFPTVECWGSTRFKGEFLGAGGRGGGRLVIPVVQISVKKTIQNVK